MSGHGDTQTMFVLYVVGVLVAVAWPLILLEVAERTLKRRIETLEKRVDMIMQALEVARRK